MVLSMIATLISETIGLDLDVVSPKHIARSVEIRRVQCQLPDIKSYWNRLKTSSEELAELIELIVVPETWFFRDGKPFDYLKTYVTSEWCKSSQKKPLQVLSVPSSSGEEPYSIAIALLEADLAPQQFAIDAIDISQKSLDKARRGVYTKNSFRGHDWQKLPAKRLPSAPHYFQQKESGYELCPMIRQLVNFQQGNVITLRAKIIKKYDIIFCRNLLIYLQPKACSELLTAIDRLLLPGGLLFVGASETGKITADNYTAIRQPFTFAYRKLPQSTASISSPNLTQLKSLSESLPSRVIPVKQSLEFNTYNALNLQKANLSKNQNGLTSNTDLSGVRKLADEGRIAEATTLCQAYLNHYPTSSAAYILLGELYQANQKNQEATNCFQKAIYLEPNSYKALVHLALLRENQGDRIGADIIWQRIRRLQNQSSERGS